MIALTERARVGVDKLAEAARWYAYGREDAGEALGEEPEAFARFYRELAEAYATETVGMRPSIRDAWATWIASHGAKCSACGGDPLTAPPCVSIDAMDTHVD